MLRSKSATILPRTPSTPTFSMHDKSEFLSWVAEPLTEVSDGSMFPVHLEKTGILTAAWTENTFVKSRGTNPTVIPNRPFRRRAIEDVPANPHTLACQANHERLRRICVERRQAIERELYTQILQDICDEVISDASSYDGWLEESNSD